jgi:hypothetical protein
METLIAILSGIILGINVGTIIKLVIVPMWNNHLSDESDRLIYDNLGRSDQTIGHFDGLPVVYDSYCHIQFAGIGAFCGKDSAVAIHNPEYHDPEFRKFILVASPDINMGSLVTRVVLAHEAGHLQLGHLVGGGMLDDPMKEKEADEYAASKCKINRIVARIIILFVIIKNFPSPMRIIFSNWRRFI